MSDSGSLREGAVVTHGARTCRHTYVQKAFDSETQATPKQGLNQSGE
jgi:hypothetical protein